MAESSKGKDGSGGGVGMVAGAAIQAYGAYYGGQQLGRINAELRQSENQRAGVRLRGAVYDKWLRNNARARSGQASMQALLQTSINEQQNYAEGRFEAGLQAASQLGAARAAGGAAGGFNSAAAAVQSASALRAARLDQRMVKQAAVAEQATTSRAKALADQTFRGYEGQVFNVNTDNRREADNTWAYLLNGLNQIGKQTSAQGVQSVLRGLFGQKPAGPADDLGGSQSYDDAAANAAGTQFTVDDIPRDSNGMLQIDP